MQFSFSFYFHFISSFVGFLFIGIYLCRGSWRKLVRAPLALGFGFILVGHFMGAPEPISMGAILVLAIICFGIFLVALRTNNSALVVERDGHNVFSLLAGAALFALTVQLHSVLFGVPVFQLVK